MQVVDILALGKKAEGTDLSIEGVFVMERGIGYFVQAMDKIDDKSLAVMVDHPELEKHLLSSIPAYGGGRFSYCDNAIVSGVVTACSRAEFPCAIGKIHSLIIYKYGEPMTVKF